MNRIFSRILLLSVACLVSAGCLANDDSRFRKRSKEATLRILDDNIWEYNLDTIPSAWQKTGVDCRDDARAPEFARLVRKYSSDIITLQEYSSHMHERLYPSLQKQGYRICTEGSGENWNYTPVFYKPSVFELVECDYFLFTPEKFSNRGTKSYTSAVFRTKKTGKVFAVISTHLWWKSDKVLPGSTEARTRQARCIVSAAEEIREKYGCPVFVCGDMNCEEATPPIEEFFGAGFVPCYKVACVYADLTNGHHVCSPKEGFSTESHRKGPSRAEGAIDHCLVRDPGKSRVLVFDCIKSAFTVPITDHYPNLIDVALQ